MSRLHRAALALAAKGLAVFPVAPRAKWPACAHGCLEGTTDPDAINRWWESNPSYNIGVACGVYSNVFVIDIDGGEGEAALRKLEAEHAELPATVESITGGGGRHLWFRLPGIEIKNSVSKLGAKIDIRAGGGFVIAPPSVHASGREYRWSVDSANSFSEAPGWLINDRRAQQWRQHRHAALRVGCPRRARRRRRPAKCLHHKTRRPFVAALHRSQGRLGAYSNLERHAVQAAAGGR
jgi:hypothetical protein